MDETPAALGVAAAAAFLVVTFGAGAPAMADEEPAHDDHGQVVTATTHAEHDSGTATDHAEHDSDTATDHAEHESDGNTQHSGDQGVEPDTASPETRGRVLGGFGVANAAVLGGALVLRRRDRRTGKGTPSRRGNRR